MTARGAARLAWFLWTIAMLLAAGAVLYLILGRTTSGPPNSFGFRGFSVIFAIAFGTVGALIASRQPENSIGWLFLGMGVLSGFQELAQEYAIFAVLGHPASPLVLGEVAAWIPSWIWVPITAGVMYLFPLFPSGHLQSPRWRWLLVVGTIGALVGAAGFALAHGPLENFSPVDNPLGVGPRTLFVALSGIGQLTYALVILAGAVSLFRRFRKAHGDEREQYKWLAFSAVFLAISFSPAFFLSGAESLAVALNVVSSLLVITAFILVPVSVGIAILKYRLYDIDIVINKTLVYGLLAAFITIVYIAIVVGVGTLVGSTSNGLLSAVAAAVVALAFQPVRRRIQRFANRLVYGERATPYEVLSELSDQLAEVYSLEDILPRTARLIVESTGATHAEIWLRAGSELQPASGWPEDAEQPNSIQLSEDELPEFEGQRGFPVRHQGALIGAVTVATRANEPLNPAQEKLIQDLASQSGLVLRNVGLIGELRASRQRLVAAQDEERRKLERNLHDGAQQQLVALTIKLRLVDSMTEKDPAKARELLATIQTEAADAIETLRDLARGIYPPLLADKGLPAALEAQANKAAIPITVRADGIGRYSQEVEAAVYFCCLEALQNIAKYANATSASIGLAESDGSLTFSVVDDGAGFDSVNGPRGSGLQNMTDRLDALGGRIDIDSAPGRGTTVSGRLSSRRLEPAG